jgi:hypothetical protein
METNEKWEFKKKNFSIQCNYGEILGDFVAFLSNSRPWSSCSSRSSLPLDAALSF